jgi:hypothetical protein
VKYKRKLLPAWTALLVSALLLAGCAASGKSPVQTLSTLSATPSPAPTPVSTLAPSPSPAPTLLAAITSGQLEENIYSNGYFGFSLTLPEGWHMASREEIARVNGADVSCTGIEDEVGDDAAVGLDAQKELFPFLVSKYALGYTGGMNPSLGLALENLAISGATAATGADWLPAAMQRMKSANLPYIFTEIAPISLGGLDFHTFEADFTMSGMKCRQVYYAAVVRGYALVLTETAYSDAEMAEMDAAVRSIRFN